MGRVQAQVEELGENRVRLRVEVPGADVHHAVEHAASDLAGAVKVPGFRQGKVPMPVLVSRIGKERLYAEAIESHIAAWFWNAAMRSRIHPVEAPEFDYEPPVSDKEPWSFTATVGVQPKPELPDWRTLEVPRAPSEVPGDAVDHELEVLRGTVAELVPVEARPVGETDTVVVDMTSESETRRDYVVELGVGRLVEELERGLLGMGIGETKEIGFDTPDAQTAEVSVTVKEIKEKSLPPLDDELARATSEFDTLDELREDISARLREQLDLEIEGAFRSTAVDTLVEAAKVEAAGPLVEVRTRDLLNAFVRSVERRGLSLETYLQVTGGDPDKLVEQIRGEAKRSVARELVLEALADELAIEVTDEEVEAELREQYEDADEAIEHLRAQGQFEQERESVRLRRALDRLVADVKPIPLELAAAREQLWTPDKEKTETETKLWIPGSKEPE